jgi:hypothetical protein
MNKKGNGFAYSVIWFTAILFAVGFVAIISWSIFNPFLTVLSPDLTSDQVVQVNRIETALNLSPVIVVFSLIIYLFVSSLYSRKNESQL